MSQRQLKSHANQNGYGQPDDQARYLRVNKATRNRLLKQFCKLESPLGSEAYRQNYDQIDWTK